MMLCICERCFPSNRGVELLTIGGHSKPRCDLCNREFRPGEQANHFKEYSEDWLRHTASCSSQYDGVTRKLAAAILRDSILSVHINCVACSELWATMERRQIPPLVFLHRYAHIAADQRPPYTYPVKTACGRTVPSHEASRTPSEEENEHQERLQDERDRREEAR